MNWTFRILSWARRLAESGAGDSIYVGEADVARDRIDTHLRTRDFWTRLILFGSKDENLNKAHVQYLEARLVALAKAARRATLENGNVPLEPSLSEAEKADAEAFLADMLLIYPLLGVTAFESAGDLQPRDAALLHLRGPSASGTGRDTPEGFVVCAGAHARHETVPSTQAWMVQLREALKARGVLVTEGEHLRLTQDYTFDSPTAAAAVLLGRTANGRVEWRDEKGRTLKEIQEESLQAG